MSQAERLQVLAQVRCDDGIPFGGAQKFNPG